MAQCTIVLLVLLIQTLSVSSDAGDSEEPYCKQWDAEFPNIEAAMMGYDPVLSNPYTRPDPGMKNKIFEAVATEKNTPPLTLNSFIGKAQWDISCDTDFKTVTLQNFNEYRKQISAIMSFVSKSDSYAQHESNSFSFSEASLFDNSKENVLKYFTENQGEMMQTEATCKIYTVGISSTVKPEFTDAFISSLRRLNDAATSEHPDNETFISFVNDYGTHFMKSAVMGAKLSSTKIFRMKSCNSSEEFERQQCVSEAAMSAATAGMCNSSSEYVSFLSEVRSCERMLSNDVDAFCGKGTTESTSAGPLPTTCFSEWSETAMKHPVPISFKLQKISSIFRSDWLDDIPAEDNSEQFLNAEAMRQYFEKRLSLYCVIVHGKTCEPAVGCGYSDYCAAGTKCVADDGEYGFQCIEDEGASEDGSYLQSLNCYSSNAPPVYGTVIVSGGYVDRKPTSSVETLLGGVLPDLPEVLIANALVAIGHQVYSCGGWGTQIAGTVECYVIDTDSDNPTWRKMPQDLPLRVHHHTAVAVDKNIWIAIHDRIFDVDTTTGEIQTHRVSFDVELDHCAVSNGSHSYILGVGFRRNEIWVNSFEYDPSSWERVQTMSQRREEFGCLLHERKLYITGGRNLFEPVEIFDLETNELKASGDLVAGRWSHNMFVLEGRPAVVGGWGRDGRLASVETFNSDTETWQTHSLSLAKERSSFSLTQIVDQY